MNDFYSYMNSEIRTLAFCKSSEKATWQDAIKQQQEADIENRLGKFSNYNYLANLAKALSYQFSEWRQTLLQAYAMVANTPSRHKAG